MVRPIIQPVRPKSNRGAPTAPSLETFSVEKVIDKRYDVFYEGIMRI